MSLTPKEEEMCRYIIQGKSNKEIAFEMGICETTLKKHLYNAFKGSNTYNRVGLAMYYLKMKGMLKYDTKNI